MSNFFDNMLKIWYAASSKAILTLKKISKEILFFCVIVMNNFPRDDGKKKNAFLNTCSRSAI